MASPRTAVGAHTAILDALALKDAMKITRYNEDKNSEKNKNSTLKVNKALDSYDYAGLQNAHQLYARTRQVSREFVPSGGRSRIVSPQAMYER